MSYQLVIGLEIHCKLKSQTKLFCPCSNEQDFETLKPNTHICPVCTAQPGALPVLQKEPVDQAIKLAHCLTGIVHPQSRFDRKSYFYPDLPSGFQITQFYQTYMTDGVLQFYTDDYQVSHTISIKEAHLENDTGKTIHTQDIALIDFNRAGTPLVEIVTNPDFRSATQVIGFLKELQRILRYNDISDADLEKGHMRCDVNLSIMPLGSSEYGTRVELKNINSYSNIKDAIDYEYHRQVGIVSQGGVLEEETRGYDAKKGETFSMRSKETGNDYRYFPEPDLAILHIDPEYSAQMKGSIRELPYITITRLVQDYKFHKEYINTLIADKDILDYFHHLLAQGYDAQQLAKWICGPLSAWMNTYDSHINKLPFDVSAFQSFLNLIGEYKIKDTQAKLVMEQMLNTGRPALDIVQELGLHQQVHIDYDGIVDRVIAEQSKVVADYQAGKLTALAFLIGQVMKASGGKADANQAKQILEQKLQGIR